VSTSWDNTKNAMMLFPALVTKKLKHEYKIELNKTVLYSGAGGRIESCTSSPYSLEGNRPTLVIQNELQWWQESNDGHDLAQVIEGNVTKVKGARKLSICNAHVPGEDSVAERDYDAWQLVKQGRAVDTGVLYDSLEAPADTPLSEIPSRDVDPEGYAEGLKLLREGIVVARGDSVWLPVDAIVDAVLDIRNPLSESRRKHLNQLTAVEDSFISPTEWDACAVPDAKLEPGDRITLAFDGSKSNDWSALVACRIEDGLIVPIAVWNPEDNKDGEINRFVVDATVRATFEQYDVVGFRADVREFESYVDMWERDFKRKLRINARPGHICNYDMRGMQKGFTLDCEKFLDGVLERGLKHNGDPTLRQHILNAKRFPQPWGGISLRKASKDSSRKIDAAVTAVMAYGQRAEWLVSKRGNRTGKAMVVK
jgi:phage terminase large subunit-like protein